MVLSLPVKASQCPPWVGTSCMSSSCRTHTLPSHTTHDQAPPIHSLPSRCIHLGGQTCNIPRGTSHLYAHWVHQIHMRNSFSNCYILYNHFKCVHLRWMVQCQRQYSVRRCWLLMRELFETLRGIRCCCACLFWPVCQV